MRKKLMAIVLVVVLILSLVPASVFAGTGYSLHSDIELTETTVNGRQAIAVSWKISAGQIGIMQAAVTFAYDESVLELIDKNGAPVTIDSKQNDYTNSAQIVGDSRYTDSNALWVAKNGAYTAVSFNRAGPTAYTFSDNTEIGKCYLGYKEGKTIEDVTRKVLRMGTYRDAAACAQSYILSFADGDFNEIYYGSETGDGDDKDLASNSTFGKDFNFAKLTPSYTVPTGLIATYGDTLKDVEFASVSEGTWSWMNEKQSVGDAQTEPKTFKAKFTPNDTETYRTVENIDVSVTVNAKTLTDVAVRDIADQEYTGSQIKPEITVTGDGGTALTADKDYTLTYGENKEVGDSKGSVTVTAKAGGNYTFTSVTKNFNIVKKAGNISISGSLNKTYDGEAVEVSKLSVDKHDSTGAITYKFYTDKECTAGETVAVPSEAGRYWVKAYMAADANYGSAESDALAFEISRADINPAVNIEGWTYGDTANAPGVTGNTGNGTVTYEYKVKDAADSTYSANAPSDAGNYIVRAIVAETANYNGNTAVKDFTILPKSITGAVIAAIEDETYTGNAVKPEPVVKDGENTLNKDTDFTYSYENNTAAGTATVKITGKGNYTGEKTQSFTINRAELTYEVAAEKNIKVGSKLPVFKAVAPESATGVKNEKVSGSVSWYSDADRKTAATENDVNLEVGKTVTLYWTFTPGSSNYNAVSGSVKFTIVDGDPQNIYFINDAVEKTYGDKNFTNEIAGRVEGGGDITWVSSNTAVVTVDSKTGEVTVVGAGIATITATAAKVPGVYAEGTASYELNVAQKAVTIEGITAEDKIYDGNTDATVSGTPEIKGLIDGDVVTVITGTASFSDKNAGANKEVTFTGFALAGDAADNYQLTAQPAPVKAAIMQKEVTISGVSATNKAYDGNRNITLTGGTLADTVAGDNVSATGGKGVVETADAGNGKTVIVTGYELTGKDKANYRLAGQPEDITVNITKIDNSDVKTTAVTVRYGSEVAVDLSALLKPGYVIGTISKTDENSIISNEPELTDGKLTLKLAEGNDSKTAEVKVSITSATNYNPYEITVTVNATSKVIPALDVKDFEKTYNGEAVDIADISKAAAADGNTIDGEWGFVGTYNLTGANAGIPVTVKFTPANEEFAAATAVITVTINKAKPSGTPEYTKITADGRTLADAELKAGTITPAGTITWDRPADTAVEKNAEYWWTFTPNDANNYEVLKGKVSPYYAAAPTPGGSGGAAVIPPAADNVTNNPADKSTTADLIPTVKDNKAETTVDAKTADKIVDKAVENNSTDVVIDAAGNNSVASSEVAVPEKTVKELAEKTDANLVIKTDNGKVDLDKTALDAVAAQAGNTGFIRLIIETIKSDENICHVDLKLITSNGAVKDFRGGNVKVTINLDKELAAKELVCVYINDNGIYTLVEGVLNADGTYTFTTGHFSEYAVMAKEEADKKIAEQLNTLIKEVNLKVRTSKTAKKNIKAVVSGDITALTDAGYTVKYKFYRSEKKASKYVSKGEKTADTYINTAGKKGTKYYYKAKAMVYSGDTLVGQTVLKQCKYGVRTWSK